MGGGNEDPNELENSPTSPEREAKREPGVRFELSKGINLIGRLNAEGAKEKYWREYPGEPVDHYIQILDQNISRLHGKLYVGEECLYKRLESATNGDFVDKRPIEKEEEVELSDGCKLTLGGGSHFIFHYGERPYLERIIDSPQ